MDDKDFDSFTSRLWSLVIFTSSLFIIIRDLDMDSHTSPENAGALWSFAIFFLFGIFCCIFSRPIPGIIGIVCVIVSWLFSLGPLFSFRIYPSTSILRFLLIVPSMVVLYSLSLCMLSWCHLYREQRHQEILPQYGPMDVELAMDERQQP